MEALLFIADAIAFVLLAYWCVVNDKRRPDQPTIGLFRFPDRAMTRRSPRRGPGKPGKPDASRSVARAGGGAPEQG